MARILLLSAFLLVFSPLTGVWAQEEAEDDPEPPSPSEESARPASGSEQPLECEIVTDANGKQEVKCSLPPDAAGRPQ